MGPNLEKIFSGESASRRTANERAGGGGGGVGVDKSTYIYIFFFLGGVQFLGTFLRLLSRPVNIKAGGGGVLERRTTKFFFGGGGVKLRFSMTFFLTLTFTYPR